MQENSRYGNTSKTINDALAQIEKEKSANAQKMYQDLLNQAYGVLSSDRSYGLQLDNSAWGKYQDMFSNDMALKNYNLARSNAARQASASNSLNLKGNGANALSSALNGYNSAKPSVSPMGSLNTNLDKYYQNPVIQQAQRTGSPYFSNPLPPAQNPNLTAWEKMKMMGAL
jgi:hypothetical protein